MAAFIVNMLKLEQVVVEKIERNMTMITVWEILIDS